MRRRLILLLLVAAIHPAGAQRSVHLALGATRSADLVHDARLDNTALKLATAPTATLGVALPINASGSHRVVIEAGYGSSSMTATDSRAGASDLGRVATLSALAMLDGKLTGVLRWQAGVGVLVYQPSTKGGVFLSGGTHRYLVGGGLSYSRPLTKALDLLVLGRYSFHEFTTPTLVERGYSSYQSVHRVSVLVGVERRF